MIRCKLAHLEARCRERGYTLAEVLPCVVDYDGEDIVVDELHPAYPRPRRGLGDMVAAGLAGIGITPERVAAALGVEDCGCEQRKQALNALGQRFGIG